MNCPECNTPLKITIYGLPTPEMMESPDAILESSKGDASKPYFCEECSTSFARTAIEGESWGAALKDIREAFKEEAFEYPDYSTVIEELEKEFIVEGLKVKESGGVVPVQATGDLNGKHFYFRFRHNNASLMVGEYMDEKSLPLNAVKVEICGLTDDSMNGFLNAEEFKDAMSKLIRLYLKS